MKQVSDRDLRFAELSLAFSAGVCATALAVAIIFTFYLRGCV